jgi:hypothetical protein
LGNISIQFRTVRSNAVPRIQEMRSTNDHLDSFEAAATEQD